MLQAVDAYGDDTCDWIAAAVEDRLLGELETGEDDEPARGPPRKRPTGAIHDAGGTSGELEPVWVRAEQGYYDEDGQLRVARKRMELPPGASLLH